MRYTVLSCLGDVVDTYNSIDAAMVAVLLQVPLKPKAQRQMIARLEKASPGAEVYTDYSTTRVVVRVLV